MNFKDASKALATIEAGKDVEYTRSNNRRKVNDLFNCVPPIDPQAANAMNLKVNVNWGEAAVLAHHARRQYANAFLKPKRFFKVSLPDAPAHDAERWAMFITKKINRVLKRTPQYAELFRNRIASIVAHGIGPQIWRTGKKWMPTFISVDNLRIPTDTRTDFDNLVWFAERRTYTPGELASKALGQNTVKGWNKTAIRDILKSYHDTNWEEPQIDWSDQPERIAELMRQNGHFYCGDAVPSIELWHLYFQDQRTRGASPWRMRVLPDHNVNGLSDRNQFLFDDGNTVFAQELSHFFHVQFGDLSSKAPFLYHSVRSLGFMLHEPCFWTNLMRCRLLQHVFENFNLLLRSSDPAGRARAQLVQLFDRGWIPEGIGIVRRDERHQIDPNLVQMAMAQLRQLMSEASSSYTQEIDSGTKKEQTAYETAVKMSMVNAMMSGLISHAFNQEVFAYYEIGRRFCNEKSEESAVQRFLRECIKFGIPRKYLRVDEWDIDPEIPIGAGNPVAEQSQVKALMEVRPMMKPTAQTAVLNRYVATMTDNPREADNLVPLEETGEVSESAQTAEFSFPLLMMGLPVRVREDLNVPDQVQTLIGLLAGEIGKYPKLNMQPTLEDIVGMRNVEKHVLGLIQRMAMDESRKPQVKEFSNTLGKLMNEVKGFEQRLAESMASQNGDQEMDPQAKAKIAALMAETQVKQQIKAMEADAERQRKDIDFSLEQERKDIETFANVERQNLMAQSQAENAKKKAEAGAGEGEEG